MELEITMLSGICKSGERKKQVKGEISGIFEDNHRKGIRGLNINVQTLLCKITMRRIKNGPRGQNKA